MSLTYLEQHPAGGEVLPGFLDRGGLRIVPSGTTMRVELDVYDRAQAAVRTVTATLTGCSLASTNEPSRPIRR